MANIQVEVIFATAERQQLIRVTLADGATVADAIAESSIARQFPEDDLDERPVGVWGHPVTRSYLLSDGDRVEIYRELKLEPREARRQLALLGQTMGGGSSE